MRTKNYINKSSNVTKCDQLGPFEHFERYVPFDKQRAIRMSDEGRFVKGIRLGGPRSEMRWPINQVGAWLEERYAEVGMRLPEEFYQPITKSPPIETFDGEDADWTQRPDYHDEGDENV